MDFKKLIGLLILVLGGSRGARALAFKDIALFSQPQKVSHRDFVILRNGQFRNMRLSYGRPIPYSSQKSDVLGDQDSFRDLARAYEHVGRLKDNIYDFDKISLFEGKAKKNFWSYLNSPTYKGGLALRSELDDLGFDWLDYKSDFQRNPPLSLYKTGQTSKLSAASKYDFLFGPETYTFGRQINFSQDVYERFGKVPHWYGICHGTAPASFSYPEPKRAVSVKGYDGREIVFSSDDIKRLAAHLWGENRVYGAQVGRRCFRNDLGNRENDCLDTNPATFHLALLNYMGLNGKTFIIDNAYDSMVWNRPVMSFSFKYRNPINRLPSRELKYSMVRLSDFADDPYAEYRSKKAYYLLGIQMTVELLYGIDEALEEGSSTAYKVNYYYDLEIDRSGTIVGGEWETLYHPDFIWMVGEDESPTSSEDGVLRTKNWEVGTPLPQYIRRLGQSAARKGKMLEFVVKKLVDISSGQQKESNNDNDLQ